MVVSHFYRTTALKYCSKLTVCLISYVNCKYFSANDLIVGPSKNQFSTYVCMT